MKLSLLVLTALIAMSMQTAYAEAFKNEPVDFRGVAWGAAYDDYADEMSLVRRDADVLVYIREEDQAGSGRDGFMKIA